MAYLLHISDSDRAYIDALPLSDTAKEKVDDFLHYAVEQVDDAFRNDPANRPAPNKPYFQVEFFFSDVDDSGNKSYHKLLVVVNDANAAFGVLILVYVDHQQV